MNVLKPVMIALFLLICAVSAHENTHPCQSLSKCKISEDDCSMKVKNGVLILENNEDYDGSIEITEDYDLYVNHRKVRLDGHQRRLTSEYYDQSLRLIKKAKDIGFEGGKIGLEGAKLGLKAVAGVFRMMSPDYDGDDLERDMEYEAHKIEIKAERLEERAEGIDAMARELEDLRDEMKSDIEELRDLDWF